MQPDAGRDHPRPACHKAHPRLARQIGVGCGGKSGPALWAHRDIAQHIALIVDRIQRRQIAFTRHAVDHLNPVQFQRVNQNLPTRTRPCRLRRVVSSSGT